jgi:hypothetical protein
MLIMAVEKRLSRFIVGSGSDWFSLTIVPPAQVGFKMELAARLRGLAGDARSKWGQI